MIETRKHKLIVVSILFFSLCFLLLVYYFFIVLPIIKTYSYAEIKSKIEKSINTAVSNVINRSISYDSLIDINYTTSGEIVSFSANQYEINSMTREIVKETQHQMNFLGQDGLRVNIGSFSGIPFFVGKGKAVNLKLIPIGAVSGQFDSEFDSVGINMTKHTLFLFITARVSVALPIKAYEIESTNQVLLAESIILGKVPEVYLSGEGLKKTLNLLP